MAGRDGEGLEKTAYPVNSGSSRVESLVLYALLGLYKLVGICLLYGTVLAILTLSPYPGLVACTVWDVCIVPRLYPVDGSERCGQYA